MAHLVASSSAFLVVAGADGILDALGNDNDDDDDENDDDRLGVEDLGGARTTTEFGLLSPVSISSLSPSSFSARCLSHNSLFLLFLSDFDLINIFPVAFLSAVFLFFLFNSSSVIFTTPSLSPAPSQLSPKCGFFPLRLAPSWHSTFLRVQQPLCPIST